MRKNFGPQQWLYPMPVLVIGTYDENGAPDLMVAAWGGIHDTNQLAVCIDPGHKTAANIRNNKYFTVSIATADKVAECDYTGIVSANDEPQKIAKSGFHIEKSANINAPLVSELPMALECEMVSFDEKTGCTVANILNVCADEKILDKNGNISPVKLAPLCFDPVNHTYLALGAVAGKAFADGKKLF